MKRTFQRTTIQHQNSRMQFAYQMLCSKCGAVEKIPFAGAVAPEFVSEKFRQKGWTVATHEGGDVCPKCATRRKPRKAEAAETSNVVELASHAIVAEPPREMSREDRRIVFAKINEVYLDENKGYDPPWTDAKVAADLGVPRDWVRVVREENFGAEAGNSEIDDVLAEARKCLESAKDNLCASQEAALRMKEQYEKASTIRHEDHLLIVARIDAIEKKLGDVLKALGRAV